LVFLLQQVQVFIDLLLGVALLAVDLLLVVVVGYFGDTVPVISRDIVPLSTSKDRDKD
jgi:hypothetical protein